MRLEHYQNFIAIVECGTITGAARKMRIAQPALSGQVRQLEEELGVELLRRSTRRVELTDAGRIFYERSKAICRIENDLRREIQVCTEGGSGTVRLGISGSLPEKFTERVLRLANQKMPAAQFCIYPGNGTEVLDMVKNGLVDIGVLELHHQTVPALKEVLSISEQLHVVYPIDNMWLSAGKENLTVSDLRSVPLCTAHSCQDIFEQACMKQGFIPNIRCVSASRYHLRFWPEQGLAAAIMYWSTVDDLPRHLCCKPLHGEQFSARRAFVVRTDARLSAVCETFLDCARQLYTGKF